DDKEFTEFKGMPLNPALANISFSPDNTKLAFTNTNDAGTALFVLDLVTQQVTQLTSYLLNAAMDTPFKWFRSSDHLLISTLPANRPKLIDQTKDLPAGPIVSTSDGQVSQLRTYQDL